MVCFISIIKFQDAPDSQTFSKSTFYNDAEIRHRSSTLPRRHRRHMSSDSTFVISSRDCSPIRRRSPVYCSGSLPRSTNSIPAVTTQTKVQRTHPNKHIINEQNRSNYRLINSGPSSYESGKASVLSGISSIDDEKLYSRTSGHSSLESHPSISTIATTKTGTRSTYTTNGTISPNFSLKHQMIKSKLTMDSSTRTKSTGISTSSVPTRSDDITASPLIFGKPPIGIPSSNSNSSITLQVTTSNESQIPNTKIFVQNSPIRSVITLENGKLLDNSNVYIINNETTASGNGDIIKQTISKHNLPAKSRGSSKLDKENELLFSENEVASETGDSFSLSEISPETSEFPTPTPDPFTLDSIEICKNVKNVNNDATMNNGRKYSLPISNTKNIVYKNMLKNVNDITPTSPLNNKNVLTFDEMVVEKIETLNLERNTIAGSVGNLRFFEKNEKIINSNCDLKVSPYESNCGHLTKLNSNPAINTDSIAQILSKNVTAVGSEPNLALNSNGDCKQKMNIVDKSNEKRDDLYNFPSLSDLSFNFTSLAAQKILKGVSINSIDTLVELNMAQEKQQNNVSATNTTQPQAIRTDYGMV